MASSGELDACVPSEECIIEATVPTGFETIAAEEVGELFQTECTSVRGKITFRTPTRKVKDILKLGGIDHCRVQILHVPSFGFTSDPEHCLSGLQQLVRDGQWKQGLDVWRQFHSLKMPDLAGLLPDSPPDHQDPISVCYSAHMPDPPPYGSNMSRGSFEQTGELSSINHSKTAYQSDHDREKFDTHDTELSNNTCSELHVSQENCNRRTGALLDNCLTMSDADHTGVTFQDSNTVLPPKFCTSEPFLQVQKSSADSVHTLSEPNRQTAAELNDKQEIKLVNQQGSPQNPATAETKFRVTCHRSGNNHCFDSMSAAASFGRAVQAAFGWQVDLKRFDVEVVLLIDGDEVSLSIALTPDSLHRRDLVAFGVTTLRPTIAYNMLRMVNIEPGHIVCDPLCGTSSIAIQGALRFPALQMSGDLHKVAMEKTCRNMQALNETHTAQGRGGLMMDALQWNACRLPLRDGVVDAFVTDLPFGKRVGRRSQNLTLYGQVLKEMSRCSRPSARAALLTADVKNMMKALRTQKRWSLLRRCGCNIGGLAAAVFLLNRSSVTPNTTTSGPGHPSPSAPHHRVNG
ncbi:tRNA (guanine(6)-N(2))-methyltransferase THUMP3-like [Babylonia areolata]|uniref:tRNA (guanine(6)-N(2))-methyltransferase THUMP3-like n=1 Tax=Babylonia areolata TaxID=304850 RepID=UPI003FD37B6C